MENQLVNACVVIGVDQNTGLLPPINSERLLNDNSDGVTDGLIFTREHQLHVLGVFNEKKASFPSAIHQINGNGFYDDKNVSCPLAEESKKESFNRSRSLAPLSNFAAGPLTAEVLAGLPTFCMPRGGYVHAIRPQPYTHHLVLTDIDGNRSYATCLVAYRAFLALPTAKNRRGIVNLIPAFDKVDNDDPFSEEPHCIYAPILVCISSGYPYCSLLRDCLSPLTTLLQYSDDLWPHILKFSSHIMSIPVPPPGPLSIEFNLFNATHIIYPSDEVGKHVVDTDLHIPLLLLSLDNIIDIMASILTQQRIIFLGSDYGIITIFIETLFAYIKPFAWRLTYVPVLPVCLSDLIEAPGPFIMGCHSSIQLQVKQVRNMDEVPGIVVVDLDKGKVDFDPKSPIARIPDWVVQGFKIRLKKLNFQFDLHSVCNVGFSTITEYKSQREIFQRNVDQTIKAACVDVMVSLFGDVMSYMRFGEIFFDKDAYLQTRLPQEKTFYEAVCASDSFERFIEERLHNPQKRDVFAVLSERLGSKKSSSRSRSSSSVTKLSKVSSFATMTLFSPPDTTLKIPDLPNEGLHTGNYYQTLRNTLDECVRVMDSRSVSLRASYLYLRGMVEVACDEPIRALQDFHRLHAASQELVPKDYVSKIMSVLDPETKEKLEKQEFYASMSAFRLHAKRSEENRVLGPKRKVPSASLPMESFVQRVRTLQIATTDHTAETLFYILAHSARPKVVRADQFLSLYNTLAEKENEANRYETPGLKLSLHDTPLKISSMISTSLGMGRLILSYHELRFAAEGVTETISIIKLLDIKEIIKFQHYLVFLPGVPALRIVNKDRKVESFFACLKTDRDLWVLLLNEMSSGQELAHLLKDPKIIEHAANNTILTDVLFSMNLPTEALCFNYKHQNAELETLSPQTRDALVRRIDPCGREAKRSTVMTILYLPKKSRSENATLWCGMASGAIMVYETDSWTCISELRYAKNRISRLLAVGNGHVWAGSYDTMIYVISTDRRKAEQQLQNHKDFISDLVITNVCHQDDCKLEKDELQCKHGEIVYSASVNGQITEWDSQALEALRTIQLEKVYTLRKLLLVNEELWCVTSDAIIVVDLKSGKQLSKKLRILNADGLPIAIESALYIPSQQCVWSSCSTKGQIAIWDIETRKHEMQAISDNAVFTVMMYVSGSVWAGDEEGRLITIDVVHFMPIRELHAHTDCISCICQTDEGHVVTGSGSGEGKLCVWNSIRRNRVDSARSLGFEVVDGRRVFGKRVDSIDHHE